MISTKLDLTLDDVAFKGNPTRSLVACSNELVKPVIEVMIASIYSLV